MPYNKQKNKNGSKLPRPLGTPSILKGNEAQESKNPDRAFLCVESPVRVSSLVFQKFKLSKACLPYPPVLPIRQTLLP